MKKPDRTATTRYTGEMPTATALPKRFEETDGTVYGSRMPRIYTASTRGRTLDKTNSLGPSFVRWCREKLLWTPLPWQEELAYRMLELRPDNKFRYRTCVVLVGRQNGKSQFAAALALWKMCELAECESVVGAAQTIKSAKELWNRAWDMGVEAREKRVYGIIDDVKKDKHNASGNEHFFTANGAKYEIVPANRRGARGLSADHLNFDEVREQTSWDGWAAFSKTTNARPNPQMLCISNAGDRSSVVLNHLIARGRAAAEEGAAYTGDLGYWEWSGVEDCELDDPEQLANACPALGYLIPLEVLVGQAANEPAPLFRTEVLCQTVASMDAAVDEAAWEASADPAMRSISGVRPVALGLEVSMDGTRATLVGAVGADSTGRIRTEIVRAWTDMPTCRAELPELVKRIRPAKLGYFASGPAAALKTELSLSVPDTVLENLTDVPSVCMNLAQMISSRRVVHPSEELMNVQVAAATKKRQGDAWRFARQGGEGSVDAVYALAAAVALAQKLPRKKTMRVVSI